MIQLELYWICDSEYGRTVWENYNDAWQEHCYFNDLGEHSSIYSKKMHPIKFINLKECNGY